MELSIKQVYQPSIRSIFTDHLHLDVTPQIKGKIYQPSLLGLSGMKTLTKKTMKRKLKKVKKSKLSKIKKTKKVKK